MFDCYGSNEVENNTQNSVSWDALNKYVVETCELETPETITGHVVGIIDLGIQPQDDAEMVFNGTEEDERKAIAEMPATYFKDGEDDKGNAVRLKCWPQKPVQCVTFAVDFSDIQLDKGQFFGDESGATKPLRLYYGGQFYTKSNGMVCGRTINLKLNKKLGFWSLDQKNIFYKMAVASKLIKPGEAFLPQDIDKLVGKPFQFEVQVFMKAGKTGGEFYTEKLKYVGGLPRGQKVDDLPKEETFMVQFNKENDETALKEIRKHIKNTMMLADNFDGSVLQKELGMEPKGDSPEPKVKKEEVVPEPTSDEAFDLNIPF